MEIPRVETYAECIRLERRVRSSTWKGYFDALNHCQENGILVTDFRGETSYLRIHVMASSRAEGAQGDFLSQVDKKEKTQREMGTKICMF